MIRKKIKPNIYFDYASTTPIDPLVLKEVVSFLKDKNLQGNPSSLHKMGFLVKTKIEESRKSVAKILGVESNEIIFTGSGTESDNLAILGIARAYKSKGNHIIVSSIEHKAITESVKVLEKEGFNISFAPVDKDGFVIIPELLKLIRKETILVSIMYVNNETGTIEPIKEIAQKIKGLKKDRNLPLLHTDACQAATILSIKPKELGVDLLTINGSKIYGPKGIGLLYVRNDIKIAPITYGGGQERGLRHGTENVCLIAGFAKALSISQKEYKKEWIRLSKLKKLLKENFKKLNYISFNSPEKNCSPNILNVSFLGIEGESLLLELDNYGIYCSTGSACASQDLKPSYVLLAMDKKEEVAHMSIRFSFGKYTTEKEIKYLIEFLPRAIKRIKDICLSEI